jgi:hypothetical protein
MGNVVSEAWICEQMTHCLATQNRDFRAKYVTNQFAFGRNDFSQVVQKQGKSYHITSLKRSFYITKA